MPLRHRPLVYVIAYPIAILIFALLYQLNSAGFYHSTARFEPSFADAGQALLVALRDAIVQNYAAHHGTSRFTATSYPPDVHGQPYEGDLSDAQLWGLSADVNSISFKMTIEAVSQEGAVRQGSWWEVDVTAPLDQRFEQGPVDQPPEVVVRVVSVVVTGPPTIDAASFFVAPPSVHVEPNRSLLVVPKNIDDMLFAYSDATRGLPAQITDSPLRMLYLSAMTITTVGYGDVVPTTTLTRTLVGIEAVAGIVLAGGFFWALSLGRHHHP